MGSTARRTDPKLWEAIKEDVTQSEKGGKAGQWSARKAQIAVQEYKREGGGYIGAKSKNNSLVQWTKEDWGTKSGNKSIETGERYLPRKARAALSSKEYAQTTAKKRKDTAKGQQFSRQPQAIADKTAAYRHISPRKEDLLVKARHLGIPGRSRMTKDELSRALAERYQ